MGYLLLAIASSALVSIVMRLSTDRVKQNIGMLAMNYLMCLGLAWGYTGFANPFPGEEGLGFTGEGLGISSQAICLIEQPANLIDWKTKTIRNIFSHLHDMRCHLWSLCNDSCINIHNIKMMFRKKLCNMLEKL